MGPRYTYLGQSQAQAPAAGSSRALNSKVALQLVRVTLVALADSVTVITFLADVTRVCSAGIHL